MILHGKTLKFKTGYLSGICILTLMGCTSVSSKSSGPGPTAVKSSSEETPQDVTSALRSVSGSLSGKEMSEKDLRDLSNQIQKDKEARSALKAVSGAMRGESPNGKYCPLCGQHLSGQMNTCPRDGTQLLPLDE